MRSEQQQNWRRESDALGEVQVPAAALYGAQTQRAVENFPISGYRLGRPMIAALARIKVAAALANRERQALPAAHAAAIVEAATEVAAGRWDAEFVVDIFQTGSGTSSNMNANEVIAARGSQLHPDLQPRLHANDHVNCSQSSNDVIPTAIRLAVLEQTDKDLLPALAQLQRSLSRNAKRHAEVVKPGRTHLMDAMPVRVGQVFGGYATQIANAAAALRPSLDELCALPLGGTAVGTGLNAPPGFAVACAENLSAVYGRQLFEAPDHFAAQSNIDALVSISGGLRRVAVALRKIADDVRWLASGPRHGLGELRLPALQPGSSMMPGKVNPVIEESVVMVCCQVHAYDQAVAQAGGMGAFELNTMLPLVAYDLLESIRLLSAAARNFASRSLDGLQVETEAIAAGLQSDPVLATALVPVIGYAAASRIAMTAAAERRSVLEVAREQTSLDEEELARQLDPRHLTGT